jgi:hypothetical protein
VVCDDRSVDSRENDVVCVVTNDRARVVEIFVEDVNRLA